MWHTLHVSSFSQTDSDLLSSLANLLQSTLRFLVNVTIGICVVMYILANVLESAAHISSITAVLIPFIACSYLALQLVSKWLRTAITIWLIGYGLSISLAWFLFQEPALSFLYILIPFGLPCLSSGRLVYLQWAFSLFSRGVYHTTSYLYRSPSRICLSC